MLQHLRTSHSESYKNLNQPALYWNDYPVTEKEKILKEFESSSTKFILCAFHEGKIVGGLGFVGMIGPFLKHNAHIGLMSIQKHFCGCGLGTAMMKYALELGKQHGFHRVELKVRTYNQAGISLYEKIGFQRVGLLKDAAFIDERYVDEYFYQITL